MVTDTMGLDLSVDVIQRIHERCEGWVAGVRLLAASVANAADPEAASLDIALEETNLAQYLVEEVLNDLSPSLREFVLDTSLLNDLDPATCDALAHRLDARRVLAHFARDGLFVSRLGGEEEAYRYHELFRDVLRMLMHHRHPERSLEIHRRAADIRYEQGRIVEAVDHALAAGEPEKAADLLVKASRDELLAGRVATVRDLATRIDAAMEHPPVKLLAVLTFSLLLGPGEGARLDREAARVVERATAEAAADAPQDWEWSRDFSVPFHGDPSILVAMFRSLLARRAGDADGILADREPLLRGSSTAKTPVAEALIWLERYAESDVVLTEIAR